MTEGGRMLERWNILTFERENLLLPSRHQLLQRGLNECTE